MIHFRTLSHMHTPALEAAVHNGADAFGQIVARQKAPGSAHHDTQSIFLRGPENPTAESWFKDEPHVDYAILGATEWIAAKNALREIRRLVETDFGKVRPGSVLGSMGKALIISLKAGGHVDWHVDEGAYAEKHWRFHLPLVTNPSAITYSGAEGAHFPVGALFFINNRVKHSSINMGFFPRIHLVVDFRQPEAA